MMNKVKTLIILFIFLVITSSFAAPVGVGSGFSYQGELLDNGAPANGSYDIQFLAYSTETAGTPSLNIPTFLATTVNNGIFSIDSVDFGSALFIGDEYWLEIGVRQAGVGSYETLSPRQRISAVPYAVQSEFLAANGANAGDVLQYNGGDWAPATVSGNVSPWVSNGSHINYTVGKVSIGTSVANASLTVDVAPASGSPFIASIDSNSVLYVAPNGGTAIGDGGLIHLQTGCR